MTVIIPTANRWDFLGRALKASLEQEDICAYSVVVDDGSSEDPPAALARLLDDPRVTFIRSPKAAGVSASRNRGLPVVKTDWVAFLDDDDVWSPVKLRAQVDLARRSGADFVYSSAAVLDERLNVLQVLPAPPFAELEKLIRTYSAIPAGQSNVLARTSLVRRLGGFDERLEHTGDWDLWIRLSAAGRGERSTDVHVGYVRHADSMSLTRPGLRAEMEEVVRRHQPDGEQRRQAYVLGARWRAYLYRRGGKRSAALREYLRAAVRYRDASMLIRFIGLLIGEWALRKARPQTRPQRPGESLAWLDRYETSAGASFGPCWSKPSNT